MKSFKQGDAERAYSECTMGKLEYSETGNRKTWGAVVAT